MKIEIEEKLNLLSGLPLNTAGRAANLAWFGFGELLTVKNKKRIEKKVAEYALHVQCSWRITKDNKILVAYRDMYSPSKQWNGKENFEWDIQDANRFDERIEGLLLTEFQPNVLVEEIQADSLGGVKIFFTEHYLLELFPDDSVEGEFWRFFSFREEVSSPHFVVTGKGIEK